MFVNSVDSFAFEGPGSADHGLPLGFNSLAKEHPVLHELPHEVAYNVRIPCADFYKLDLRKWREAPPYNTHF